MKARAVIHINGHDYDAISGKRIGGELRNTTTKKHAPPKAIRHLEKPSHVHHAPAKSVTLSRIAVKKPKILSDIRHIPINVPDAKSTNPSSHVNRSHTSPKVMHFAKIEPRKIDVTASPESHFSYPDSPPPIAHRRSHSKVEEHIKRQLSIATAHQATHHKKTRSKRKKASILSSAVAVIAIITGFIVYQSIPSLSVDLASEKAGFSALLPKYTPGGFTLSKGVNYSPGRVVLSFRSNTDDRQYQIEQQTSDLNTVKLEEQIKNDTNGKYQAISAGSVSVFFYNNTAKWSKNGILYSLTGESGLSSSQIASIATSL